MPKVPGFAEMSPDALLHILKRKLGYVELPGRGKGSHKRLESDKYPTLTWAFAHSRRTLAPVEVRNILVKSVGLTLDEAREVVR